MAGTLAFVRGAPGFQAAGDFKREGVNVRVDIPTTLEGGRWSGYLSNSGRKRVCRRAVNRQPTGSRRAWEGIQAAEL